MSVEFASRFLKYYENEFTFIPIVYNLERS